MASSGDSQEKAGDVLVTEFLPVGFGQTDAKANGTMDVSLLTGTVKPIYKMGWPIRE